MYKTQNIVFAAFLILEVSFFLPIIYTSISAALLLVLLLFKFSSFKKEFDIKSNHHYFIYFFILLIGGIWTSNIDYFVSKISQNVAFVVIPLICCFLILFNKTQFKYFKILYVVVANLALLICFSRAVYDYYDTGYYVLLNPDGIPDRNRFLYHEFTRYIGFHAVYLAFYLTVSFILVIDFFKKSKIKLVYIPLIIFNVIGIILCKSSIFYFIIAIYSIHSIFFYFNIKLYLKAFLILLIIILTYFIIQFKIKTYAFSFNLTEMLITMSAIDVRLIKWYSALDIWQDYIIFGTGTGDSRGLLREYYKKIGFLEGYKYSYNTHNQYLETLLRNGLLGLSSLVYLFYNYFKKVIKKKNSVALWFGFSVLIFSITESVFEVQRGLVYIIFFLCFFEAESRNTN